MDVTQDKFNLIKSLYSEFNSFERVADIVNASLVTVKQVILGMDSKKASHQHANSKVTTIQKAKIEQAYRALQARGERVTLKRIKQESNLTAVSIGRIWDIMKSMNIGYPLKCRKQEPRTQNNRERARPMSQDVNYNESRLLDKAWQLQHEEKHVDRVKLSNSNLTRATQPLFPNESSTQPILASSTSRSDESDQSSAMDEPAVLILNDNTLSKQKSRVQEEKDIFNMSVDDVVENILEKDNILIKRQELFRENEIDGKSFMLLDQECMKNDLGLKLGPILKIKHLQEEYANKRKTKIKTEQ